MNETTIKPGQSIRIKPATFKRSPSTGVVTCGAK